MHLKYIINIPICIVSLLEQFDDGDTTTVKIAFTQEANAELERYMYSKDNFVSINGNMIRDISKEAFQTFYVMTKEPDAYSKEISDSDKQMLLDIGPDDITFTKLCNWFGNTINIEDNDKTKKPKSSRFNCNDIMTINPTEFSMVKETVHTTVGRFIFNKLLLFGSGFDNFIDYQNDVMVSGNIKKIEKIIVSALIDDKMTTKQMIHYIDTRNWLGLELHAVITSSFSPAVSKLPREVKDLKKKLLEENKEAIDKGDITVVDDIAKKLIDKEMEVLKGDYGLDLYQSGARGSVGNHLKNMQIMRGAVYNSATGKYDIITNSLMDGLDKKDLAPHSNSIVIGSYARGIKTADSGYKTKELLAACGAEVLDPNKGSDCGSVRYLERLCTKEDTSDFLYRYIIDGDKLVMLDRDNISKYYGKVVKMRSPQYCRGVNGNQHVYCNVCMGDYFYKINKLNVGLLSATITGVTMKASLAKFHDSQVKFYDIDIDDMLV